ncbi:MAG: hypothetical protein ACP5DZ_09620 [Bacteroidales bacterium]
MHAATPEPAGALTSNFKPQMVTYHNNILGIDVRWLAETRNGSTGELVSYWDFDNLRRAGKVTHLRHGGNGRTALVESDSMPNEINLQ